MFSSFAFPIDYKYPFLFNISFSVAPPTLFISLQQCTAIHKEIKTIIIISTANPIKNINHIIASRLSRRLNLPAQEQEGGGSQDQEDCDQGNNVQCKVGVQHVQLLQCRRGGLEVAIRLEALQLLATVTISGQSGALESVTDVGQVCDPAQVHRYRIEADEEAGEQEEGHGHDRGQEDTILHVHCGSHNQTHTLRHEGDEQAGRQEHEEPEPLHRLCREVVHNGHVHATENRLKGKERLTGC